MCFGESEEGLVGEVVLEGEGFDVFLYAWGDLTVVAEGVDVLEVGDYGVEDVLYLGLSRIDLFGDGG